MDNKKFIENKLKLLKKDNPRNLGSLAESISKITDINKPVKIKADGNWFQVNFDAIQIKNDRAVISAKRLIDGFVPSSHNPSIRNFKVTFEGTRAAYLFGFYETSHRIGGWPYIGWDIRSYINSPADPNIRVYVKGFRAHHELSRMISEMQNYYGVKNIVNSYINDNLSRFQLGLLQGKSP